MLGGLSSKQFIGAIFFLAVLGVLYYGPFGKSPKKNTPAYLVGEFGDLAKNRKGQATVISEEGHILRRWSLPFSVHSVAHNNAQPFQLMAIESQGNLLSILDARVKTTAGTLKSPDGIVFAGHGLFSLDGTRFYATAMDSRSYEGLVLVYDSSSLALLNQFSSGGARPHDLQHDLRDSKNLIVVNSGGPDQKGNIVWLSEQDLKVVKAVSLDEGVAPKHILQRTSGEIFVFGSSQRDPEKSPPLFGFLASNSEEVQYLFWVNQFKGEILNVYLDEARQKLWLTLPHHDSVLVLEQKTLKIAKEFKAEKPRSILAVTPHEPKLLMISVASLSADNGLQKAFDLVNIAGSDTALDDPRIFYAEHAIPLEVTLQDY